MMTHHSSTPNADIPSATVSDERNRDEQDPSKIRAMFDRITPTYDFLNHALTLGIDRHWRSAAIRALGPLRGKRALDLCCGTGDITLALAREAKDTFTTITAVDFSPAMLAAARRKIDTLPSRDRIALIEASVENLPALSESFEAAIVAFGIRNVRDIPAALSEAFRALTPGGRFCVLEFSTPRYSYIRGPYLFYLRHVLPRLGALISGDREAYRYLNSSAEKFPSREAFATLLRTAGFETVTWRELSGGIVTLYIADKPRAE